MDHWKTPAYSEETKHKTRNTTKHHTQSYPRGVRRQFYQLKDNASLKSPASRQKNKYTLL